MSDTAGQKTGENHFTDRGIPVTLVAPSPTTQIDRASNDPNTQTTKKVVRWAFFNAQLRPLERDSNVRWSLLHINTGPVPKPLDHRNRPIITFLLRNLTEIFFG